MADMDLDVGIHGFENGVNILDIEVPPHLKRRVSTGLDWFDLALGEFGACPSAVYMLTGVSGGGKTTAMLQLADSVTGNGDVAIYNSGEESLHQVAMTCERLNIKNGFLPSQEIFTNPLKADGTLKNADCKGHEGLLPWATRVYKERVEGEFNNIGEPKTLFLICDSLQTLNDGKYGLDTVGPTPERVVKDLTEWAKKMKNVVVIFIGQVNKDGVFKGTNKLKHAVDGHFHIKFNTDKKDPMYGTRMLCTEKNRFGYAGHGMYYNLESDGLHAIGPTGESHAA